MREIHFYLFIYLLQVFFFTCTLMVTDIYMWVKEKCVLASFESVERVFCREGQGTYKLSAISYVSLFGLNVFLMCKRSRQCALKLAFNWLFVWHHPGHACDLTDKTDKRRNKGSWLPYITYESAFD